MKATLRAIMWALTLSVVFTPGMFAQGKPPKFTAEEVYKFFEQYTPQDIVDRAKEAVKFYQEVAKAAKGLSKEEEEKLFMKALIEFHHKNTDKPISEFPLTFIFVPQRCDEGRVVAHYIPGFFEFGRMEGFIKKYKDVNGKKVAMLLCQEARQNPNGIWAMQYQWWPETNEPLKMGLLMIPIPGTPYELEGFYPTIKYTEEQLNKYFRN